MLLFDVFQDVMGALVGICAGYLAAVVVQLLLSYLIALEGRRVLLVDGRMSPAYYLQLGVSWMIAGAAGAVVMLKVYPEWPMSAVSILALATLVFLAQVRLRNKAPRLQSIADTVLLMLCVLVGLSAPAYLHLK